jgi:hypothetical protein
MFLLNVTEIYFENKNRLRYITLLHRFVSIYIFIFLTVIYNKKKIFHLNRLLKYVNSELFVKLLS